MSTMLQFIEVLKMKYYDGTKLLSLMDKNGNKPEIYICTTNRTAGKTSYFNRYYLNRFIKHNEKFVLLYRFQYELDKCADKFFKDIRELFFKNDFLTSKPKMKGLFHELYFNDESCGYAISLNSADTIKKYSHFFNDVERILFDEFQSENNHYCPNEVRKFISIHTSIARGRGEQIRYVPVHMIANPVSLLNPYYTAMNISSRLSSNTNFLKGDGWVLEQGFNENAAKAQKQSGFMKSFNNEKYTLFSIEGKYLNDNSTFIEKPKGENKYLCTLKYNDEEYSIREYRDLGIIYCDDVPDKTFPHKIAVSVNDHDINYVMLKNNDLFLSNMRFFFEKGYFRFKNLKCKEALLTALSY